MDGPRGNRGPVGLRWPGRPEGVLLVESQEFYELHVLPLGIARPLL